MSQLMTLLWIGILVCVIGSIQSQEVHLPAEKGQPTTLECSFSSPVTSVTWKFLDVGNKEVDVTTCTTTTCTDQLPQNFTGHIAVSAGVYRSTLNITSVTVDKTQFRCLTNTGVLVANISIEVYVVASPPVCILSLVLNKYVDVTCATDNVYPDVRGAIHRREPYVVVVDRNASFCTVGPLGSGSKGDRTGECTFRVLFGNLLKNDTFFTEFFPVVWNNTTVNKPAVSPDVQVQFSLPRVVIYKKDCPGIDGSEIMKGINTKCRCDLNQSGQVTGFVRWFKKDGTRVGDEDPNGRYSILTVAYNASDPDAEYECRAVNPSATYYYILFKPNFAYQEVQLPAEKGQSITLECSFSSPVTSVTWKFLDVGNKEVDVTTCTATSCTDQMPQNFTGHIAVSAGVYKSTLNITGVTVDKTQFKCFTDAGVLVADISIEVYVVASPPTCRQSLVYNKYVDVTCVTDNVYPAIRGVLRRREPLELVLDRNASSCTVGLPGTGSKGDRTGQCTFRVPFGNLLENNTFFTEFLPVVWNNTIVNKPAVSRDYQLQFSPPRVVINKKDCPGIDGSEIPKGTNTSCRCDLTQSGLVNGLVRWFKKDGTVVGDEDPNGRYSILTVGYNASDPDAEYDCRAVNPSASYYHILFKPNFASGASGNPVSGLVVVMALITACIGVTI